MARTLDHFEFSKMGNRRSNYDQYMDGQIWALTVEKDAPHLNTVEALRGSIRSAVVRKGFTMQTQIIRAYLDEEGSELDERNSELVFRVYKVDDNGEEIEDFFEDEE